MRVEVQFFEPLPSQLSYPGIIELQEEKKKVRLAAKTRSKNNRNNDDNMNGNDNGDTGGDIDNHDGDRDIGRHEEMGTFFLSLHFLCFPASLLGFDNSLPLLPLTSFVDAACDQKRILFHFIIISTFH